jgi:hypothetical protein
MNRFEWELLCSVVRERDVWKRKWEREYAKWKHQTGRISTLKNQPEALGVKPDDPWVTDKDVFAEAGLLGEKG